MGVEADLARYIRAMSTSTADLERIYCVMRDRYGYGQLLGTSSNRSCLDSLFIGTVGARARRSRWTHLERISHIEASEGPVLPRRSLHIPTDLGFTRSARFAVRILVVKQRRRRRRPFLEICGLDFDDNAVQRVADRAVGSIPRTVFFVQE